MDGDSTSNAAKKKKATRLMISIWTNLNNDTCLHDTPPGLDNFLVKPVEGLLGLSCYLVRTRMGQHVAALKPQAAMKQGDANGEIHQQILMAA